jgi:gliding motility-associated-like protein
VRDTIVVTDNPINSWTMPPDSSICGSDMLVTITNAPAGTNFTWYDAAGGSAHWFSVSGTYTTTADYMGCQKQDDITLMINPVPQLSLGNDTMFCASSPNVLQPDIFGTVTSYQWNNNSTNTMLPISGSGLYWLEVSTANGCKARDTINVIDNPINNWQAPADTSICGNNLFVALSNFPAGTNFTWSDAVTGSTRNFNSSGSFGITADHAGCLKLDAMDVGVHPVPTISLGNDTMYCASSPNILQPATTGSIASYQWNNGGAASSLPITNTGMYWLEVTTDMGCKARDTVNVANNPINNWLAPNDTSICGTSHQVVLGNYPAGTTFAWFDASTANNRVFTTSGNYTITANYIGCLKQDAIDVGVHPIPVVNLGNDTMYCATNPNVLQSTITGNISGLTWNTGATAASLPITANGTYWLEANTAFGCKHRDTIIVTNNPLNAWRALADTSICDETVYNASLKNYPAGTDFTWYDGTKGASHSFDSAGSYKVLADLIGCLKQDSVAVAVRPLPVVEVGNDSTLCYGFTMPLKVYHPGASYLWSNGRTDSAITAGQGGIIWAQATLNGCSYRDSMTLAYVDCSCNVSIPNAFSPNGDGVNDAFKVHIECVPKDYVLTVYNRFGQTIFRTSDIAKGWNGKLKQSEMPVGTYYYVLTYFNEGQQKKELYKGYVVLLK